MQGDPGAFATKTDQAGVVAGPGREALRTDVQRLEQIRLAGPVRPDDKYEARLQLELEPSVRAEISQRDLVDDQALTGQGRRLRCPFRGRAGFARAPVLANG